MTGETVRKAYAHIKLGGVERTGPDRYVVTSATSSESYGVWLYPREYCTCPASRTCSHITAATIVRAKRQAKRADRRHKAEDQQMADLGQSRA